MWENVSHNRLVTCAIDWQDGLNEGTTTEKAKLDPLVGMEEDSETVAEIGTDAVRICGCQSDQCEKWWQGKTPSGPRETREPPPRLSRD